MIISFCITLHITPIVDFQIQIHISIPELYPELHTNLFSIYLHLNSTWMSNKYLIHNMPQTKHLIFLLKPAPTSSFSVSMHDIIFNSLAQAKIIEVIIGFSFLYIYKQSINKSF